MEEVGLCIDIEEETILKLARNPNQPHDARKELFLNKALESPWKNCAPISSRYFKERVVSRNYIYNLLEYHKWTHFKKDCVLTLLRKSCKDIFFKNKKWRELCGLFCINPNKTVAPGELKYIYECVYEMTPHEIEKLLKNVEHIEMMTASHSQLQLPVLQSKSTLKGNPTNATNVTSNPSIPGNRTFDMNMLVKNTLEQRTLFKHPRDYVNILPKLERSSPSNKSTGNTGKTLMGQRPPVSYRGINLFPNNAFINVNSRWQSAQPYKYFTYGTPVFQPKVNILHQGSSEKAVNKKQANATITKSNESIQLKNSIEQTSNVSNFEINEVGDIVFPTDHGIEHKKGETQIISLSP